MLAFDELLEKAARIKIAIVSERQSEPAQKLLEKSGKEFKDSEKLLKTSIEIREIHRIFNERATLYYLLSAAA